MDDRFKIFIEQLRDGHTETIAETFSSEFLDIREKDLSFPETINVSGEAYLAEDNLVLLFNVETFALIPCTICNDSVRVNVKVKDFYSVTPIKEVKGGVFNFREALRETILLETPGLAECNQGECPHRKSIEKFLKKEPLEEGSDIDEGFQPFADIDFEK